MKKFLVPALLVSTLGQAAPTPSSVNLHFINNVQYVNPYDFARSFGGGIAGKSSDRSWVLTLRGKSLKLVQNSATAYLNGQPVKLSKVVGYAKGVLLAPYADLVRLLGAPSPEAARPAALPARPKSAQAPAKKAAPALQAQPVSTPSAPPSTPAVAQASTPEAPAAPQAEPPQAAPAAQSARASRNAAGPYIIQSDVPANIEGLSRANYELALAPESVGVDTVVQACQSGVSKLLGAAPTFAARPFVFVHPEGVYSVRSSAGTAGGATTNFTCLTQARAGKLVMLIEWQTAR